MTKRLFDLSGNVAVVTGASSGLGVQMAKALARQGADLAILARRKERLEQVAKDIRALGVKCIPVVCDVTVTDSVVAAASMIQKEFGRVDILVNNAGGAALGPAENTSDDDWNHVIRLDLTGVFVVAREFGKLMIQNNYGRIINIASMYGLVGNMAIPTSSYHAAKGGVVNLTRALAAEWAKYNITVNAICPGFFYSELTGATLDTEEFSQFIKQTIPLGRYGKEGELDTAAVFLAAKESGYVTGSAVVVDGGYTAV